jgi:hypothetical protein
MNQITEEQLKCIITNTKTLPQMDDMPSEILYRLPSKLYWIDKKFGSEIHDCDINLTYKSIINGMKKIKEDRTIILDKYFPSDISNLIFSYNVL